MESQNNELENINPCKPQKYTALEPGREKGGTTVNTLIYRKWGAYRKHSILSSPDRRHGNLGSLA